MRTSYFSNCLIVALFLVACSVTLSCVRSKQAAVKKAVAAALPARKSETDVLSGLGAKKDLKLSEGKIDTTTSRRIDTSINLIAIELDSFSAVISFLDRASKFKPLFVENKALVKQKLDQLKQFQYTSPARLRRLNMIDSGLDWASVHVFNLAAFFGPGKYQIPAEKMGLADTSFSPVLDSLVKFYYAFAGIDRKATLIILGYADGTGFNPASATYRELLDSLHLTNPAKEQLNQKLSEFRADKIGDVMEILLSRKINNYDSVKTVDFVFMEKGKGEEYPSRKIRNYQVNDERRRVVLFYWNILPKN